jgi:thymidylate synthase
MEFVFEDVNEALPVLWHALWNGAKTGDSDIIVRDSRNGPVREFRDPVIIKYRYPRQRVLLSKVRDANPFFHLFEAIWMLAGRNDVQFVGKFARRMYDFSDDGGTLYGAYGWRWKHHLPTIINNLRTDPNGRRNYIPLFEPNDVAYKGKDMPCNVGVAFYVRNGCLDMSVFNRSNDLIYGALGANYVHFGFLQEYLAALTGYEVGTYTQISSCLHLYTEFDITKKMAPHMRDHTPTQDYASECVKPSKYPILNTRYEAGWQEDAKYFLETYTYGATYEMKERWWNDEFFQHVAAPMFKTWHLFNVNRVFTAVDATSIMSSYEAARTAADQIQAADWRYAAIQWMNLVLERRHAKAEAKA